MPTISDFLRRTVPMESADDHTDLTLGLPLESASGTIYPVFRTSKSTLTTDRSLRQIGYLEIGDSRSDFVSLEPRNPTTFLITALVVLSLVLATIIRRMRR